MFERGELERSGRLQLVSVLGLLAGLVVLFTLMGMNGCRRQDTSEIVIGHQADLSGGISSWGYWLDVAAKKAVEQVNNEGGIAGKKVRLVIEDTETNPTTGVRKLRKLIQQDHADFVIGSVHSGVMMASVPLAKELKTLYIPIAMAAEATGEQGNRYVFRINSHVREQVQAGAEWVVKDPGGPQAKKWTIVVSDYQWGWSHEDWFSKKVAEAGGQILTSIRIPQGTKDFLPYLSKIPKDTEAIYFIFFGADSIGFMQQLYDSGYRGKKFTAVCTLEAIDIEKLGAAAEGTWVLEYLPRNYSQEPADSALMASFKNPHHNQFRNTIGIDDQGHQLGNPDRVVACSHAWATYEAIFMLKKAVEESGWKSKADDDKLIAVLEGMQLKHSTQFPQGDDTIRPEDHQGFHQHWMSRVEGGKLMVKFLIPAEKVMFPASTDFRTQQ